MPNATFTPPTVEFRRVACCELSRPTVCGSLEKSDNKTVKSKHSYRPPSPSPCVSRRVVDGFCLQLATQLKTVADSIHTHRRHDETRRFRGVGVSSVSSAYNFDRSLVHDTTCCTTNSQQISVMELE